MFLTTDELVELTGYKLPGRQRQWLTDKGWPFQENAAGYPKILRAVVEQRMGLGAAEIAPKKPKPNLASIL